MIYSYNDPPETRDYSLGPNDGGIKRGDSEETGDEEARPSDDAGPDGSGVEGGEGTTGHVTGDASSLGGGVE